MKKIFLISLFVLSLFTSKSFALTGEATSYEITITRIEMCDSTSTDTTCNNSVVLYSGDSGGIDIASTTAGSAAASLGDLSAVAFGTTYTYLQITMERAMTLAGTVTNGFVNCSTIESSFSSTTLNGIGARTATEVAGTYYAGIPGYSGHGNFMNSTTAGDGTGTDAATGTVDSGDSYFEWREALTTPFTMEAGKIPTVIVAFGTTTALGYLEEGGDLGSSCNDSPRPNRGFYGNTPDVDITIK